MDFQMCKRDFLLFRKLFSMNMEITKEDLQLEFINEQCKTILKTQFQTIGVPEIFKYLEIVIQNYKNTFLTFYLCSR